MTHKQCLNGVDAIGNFGKKLFNMTPAGMLINKYLEKRDAERLKREKEEQERKERKEREYETRKLQLSARKNLYEQRVNAGTANAFERKIQSSELANLDSKQLEKELNSFRDSGITDQNIADAYGMNVTAAQTIAYNQTKEKNLKTLGGKDFDEFTASGGKGRYNVGDINNLVLFDTKKKLNHKHVDEYIGKVQEIGAFANMEIHEPRIYWNRRS